MPVTVTRVSTRLLVYALGALPAKSPPLVLLAMIVLARLLMVALFCMPPPDNAELPDRVEFVTVRFDNPELTVAFKIPPPLPVVVLPNKVELEIVRLELVLMMPPPPLAALLFEMVELETEMVLA